METKHHVTLICTRHKESGNCNSYELYNIIQQIEPEIIFEELSHENFDAIYSQGSFTTLESNTVKKYKGKYRIDHIPVDTHPLPDGYYEDLDLMYDRICNNNMIYESRSLRYLLDRQAQLENEHGLAFLKSDQNDKVFEEIDALKEKVLNILNEEKFFHTRTLEKGVIEKREYEIIKNIYDFSAKRIYREAVLFIGSGHKKSIGALIKKFEMQEGLKLEWEIYDGGRGVV
jgi:hypothetical protein